MSDPLISLAGVDLDAIKFIELLLGPCDDGKPDHAWRKCRRCLAISELEQRTDMARRFLSHAVTRLRARLREQEEQPIESEVQIAERIARGAHAGQKDTVTGADYITHVERVVGLVEGAEAKAVAWLHDVIEDTNWTYADLERDGISQIWCRVYYRFPCVGLGVHANTATG